MDDVAYRNEYRRFYTLLRTFRQEAGLRQVDVARKLGVHQSFVSKYENGERRLDVIEADQVAEAMGTT